MTFDGCQMLMTIVINGEPCLRRLRTMMEWIVEWLIVSGSWIIYNGLDQRGAGDPLAELWGNGRWHRCCDPISGWPGLHGRLPRRKGLTFFEFFESLNSSLNWYPSIDDQEQEACDHRAVSMRLAYVQQIWREDNSCASLVQACGAELRQWWLGAWWISIRLQIEICFWKQLKSWWLVWQEPNPPNPAAIPQNANNAQVAMALGLWYWLNNELHGSVTKSHQKKWWFPITNNGSSDLIQY